MQLRTRNLTIAGALLALSVAASALSANAKAVVVWNDTALEEAGRGRMRLTAEQSSDASRKSSEVLQRMGPKISCG